MESVTVEEFREALPKSLRKSLNPRTAAKVTARLGDPEAYEAFRENLLGYTHVLTHGKFRLTNYIDAVKYVSYRLMGKTNKDSYFLVFPEKKIRWAAEGVQGKDQASYITSYNQSKLVNLIYEQTLIPVHVLNRDNYQRAINAQIELMLTAKSEMVRATAANSVLTHLKPPEAVKVDINISTEGDSAIDALTASTQELVNQQKRMLASGLLDAEQLAHQRLTVNRDNDVIEDAEFEEVPQKIKKIEDSPGIFD